MNIPFLELSPTYFELKSEIDAAVARVLSDGWYILGKEVALFEEEFARYVGVKHCIGVGNGLDALVLALIAFDVGPGAEVIVPSNTYVATALAVSRVGAEIRFVEPDPATYNLDPERLRQAITKRTAAVIPVHLYGLPADMAPILALAQQHGFRVIEDSAQAHGSTYMSRRTGSLGHVAAFSFYPTKCLGAFGDGGCVVTDDDDVAERIRILRNYGSRQKYFNLYKGFNSRLDELQAAILRVKLRYLDQWNERRRQLANSLLNALADIPGVVLPSEPQGSQSCWHLFVIRTRYRETMRRALDASGIKTMIHYPVPPYRQQAYADLGLKRGSFPIADQLADEVLSLPMGPHMTEGEWIFVLPAIINDCLGSASRVDADREACIQVERVRSS